MPKGVYDRAAARANRIARMSAICSATYEPEVQESDDAIAARIGERFEILEIMTEACIVGNAKALIVSGPPGLGKSYTVERVLSQWDPNETMHTIVKGYVRATGLVKLLYRHREPGQVLVFDDADYVFMDEISLDIIKSVCDTNERRRVSWLSEGTLIDEETAARIPKTFDFEGTIIFITNKDFDAMIAQGNKLSPHLEALVSRSHYIDLALKSRRDYIIRLHQLINQGLLNFLSTEERIDVINFIDNYKNKLREVSARIALKIGKRRQHNPSNWLKIAKITCCR